MGETINQVLVWVGSVLGGVSISAIITAIICGVLKGGISKTISKINVKQIAENATNEAVNQIKHISFKQNIQPIVEAELVKVTEEANRYIERALAETQARYDKLVKVIENLAAYFDNSIGVSEEAKERLREAIKEAEIKPEIENVIEIEEIIVEDKKASKKSKSAVVVER